MIWGIWKNFVVVGVAMIFEPEAEELFVDVFRVFALVKKFLVGISDPIAAGIGGMDFIDQANLAIFIFAEFVLGIDEDEAML